MKRNMKSLNTIPKHGSSGSEASNLERLRPPLMRRKYDHPSRRPTSESTSRGRKRRKLNASAIEDLPLEVLEQIFFHFYDLNLLIASPVIAVRLSSERVYRRTFSFYFPNKIELARKTKPRESNALETPHCRSPRPSIFIHAGGTGGLFRTSGKIRLPPASSRVHEAQNFALRSRWLTWERWKAYSSGFVVLGKGCHIPQKLLKRPLTTTIQHFLYELQCAGACVDPLNTMSLEYAEERWKEAVHASDYSTLALLSGRAIGYSPSSDLIFRVIRGSGYDETLIRLLWEIDYIKTLLKLPRSVPVNIQESSGWFPYRLGIEDNIPIDHVIVNRIWPFFSQLANERDQVRGLRNYSLSEVLAGNTKFDSSLAGPSIGRGTIAFGPWVTVYIESLHRAEWKRDGWPAEHYEEL